MKDGEIDIMQSHIFLLVAVAIKGGDKGQHEVFF